MGCVGAGAKCWGLDCSKVSMICLVGDHVICEPEKSRQREARMMLLGCADPVRVKFE